MYIYICTLILSSCSYEKIYFVTIGFLFQVLQDKFKKYSLDSMKTFNVLFLKLAVHMLT